MQEIENENIKEPTEINVQNKQLVIPVWERYLMTVLEASEYYHIGENKLRNVIDLHPNTEFLIMNFRTIQQLQCLLFLLRYGAYFSPVGFAYHAGFRCSVSEFGAMRLNLSAALVGGHTRSRSCVMPSISSSPKL